MRHSPFRILLLLLLLLPAIAGAQVNGGVAPYTFVAGQTIRAAEVNANFAALFSGAFPVSGGSLGSATFTGTLLFSPDATFDIGQAASARPKDIFASRDITLGRNLSVAGNATVMSVASFLGGVVGDNFSIADTTGNVDLNGTLTVGGAGSLETTLGVAGLSTLDGGITADSGAFSVADGSGTITTLGNVVAGNETADAVGTPHWSTRTAGWRGTYDGIWDVRYLYADEMHVKAFIADLEMALAGSQIIAKSVAKLAAAFTAPSNTTPVVGALVVEEFAGFTGQVFENGDTVAIRSFTRSGSGGDTLDVSFVVGTVTYDSRDDTGQIPKQTYTFTRASVPSAGAAGGNTAGATVIPVGTLALDFGASGSGYWETVAVDGQWNGAATTDHVAGYGPYAQAVTWTGSPVTGANRKIRYRAGNLAGSFGYGLTDCSSGVCWGFGAGDWADEAITVDQVNGVRFWQAGVAIGSLSGTTWTLGKTGSNAHLTLTPTQFSLYDATNTEKIRADATGLNVFGGTITGALVQTMTDCGTVNATGCVEMDAASLRWYNDSAQLIGTIDGSGMRVAATTAFNAARGYQFTGGWSGGLLGLYGYGNGTSSGSLYLAATPPLTGGSGSSSLSLSAVSNMSVAGNALAETTILLSSTVGVPASSKAIHIAGGDIEFYPLGTWGFSAATLAMTTGVVTVKSGVNFAVDTSTLFVDAASNFVGINDATPSYPLDVTGTARFTGLTTTSGGVLVNGSAGVGAAATAGTFSYDGTTLTQFTGDGTGYSWQLAKRSGSVTTPFISLTDNATAVTFAGDIYATGFRVASPSNVGTTAACLGNGGANSFLGTCTPSSRRYKMNITPAETDWAQVLKVEPVWFQLRPEVNASREWHFGAIAEEVDALGLSGAVQYDAEGRPERIYYDKIALYLIPLVKAQQQQLEALERRLLALEQK